MSVGPVLFQRSANMSADVDNIEIPTRSDTIALIVIAFIVADTVNVSFHPNSNALLEKI